MVAPVLIPSRTRPGQGFLRAAGKKEDRSFVLRSPVLFFPEKKRTGVLF
jgi:hypothetical protein